MRQLGIECSFIVLLIMQTCMLPWGGGMEEVCFRIACSEKLKRIANRILPWKLVQICCPPTRAAADSDLVCLLQNLFTVVSRMQLFSLSKTRSS